MDATPLIGRVRAQDVALEEKLVGLPNKTLRGLFELVYFFNQIHGRCI